MKYKYAVKVNGVWYRPDTEVPEAEKTAPETTGEENPETTGEENPETTGEAEQEEEKAEGERKKKTAKK